VEPFSICLAESQSLTAHVVRTGEPLLIRDWQVEGEHLSFVPLLPGGPIVSWLGVPLVFKEEVLGAIGVQSYEPYAFLVRHQRLLAAIAYQASINLQNARLVADLKLVNTDLQEMVAAQAHLLNTIEEMVAALNSGAGLEELRRTLEKELHRG
jgi:GAF domain-containing protein